MNDPKFTQYLSLLDSIPISNDPIGILMGIAWQFEDYCEKTVPLPELIGKTGISQYTQIFYDCVLNIPARIIYHRQEHNY